MSADALSAALRLGIDTTTLRVIDQLHRAGIPCLLLKGPAIAQWLYDASEERPYADTDVLVPTLMVQRVVDTLGALGFAASLGHAAASEQDGHSVMLAPAGRTDSFGEVDVHFSLPGVEGPAAVVWDVLASHQASLTLRGVTIPALDPAGRALVVTLHAARDGVTSPQTMEDLRRLLERYPPEAWPEVVTIARRLGALAALVRGLELQPRGLALIASLGLGAVTSVDAELRRMSAPPVAYGLARLAETTSLREQLFLLTRELWPTAAFLDHWCHSTGRRHRPRWRQRLSRWWYLTSSSRAALQAWRRAKERSQSSPVE